MLKTPKSNNPTQRDGSSTLKRARKLVYRQAMLAGLMIVLMVVVLFAITAAWYTNVVQTGNLMFKTKSWGFDGDVTVLSDAIQAAPGDEGVIELTARSKSDSITTVSATLSNHGMPQEMQQRIYFYVDTQKTRNGEQMDRVYLSDTDAYTYTLYPQQDLLLTKDVHNEALLKWHWVYDVLGYYVLGTYTAPDAENGIEGGMSVTEYLRPIEYDYDEASIEFDTVDGVELGTVTKINGDTPEKFLYYLSLDDGYEGTIGEIEANGTILSTANAHGYYPVEVDAETGYGVYAYLCDYSEIMANTAYDTKLGQDAAEGTGETYTANLTVSAQNSMIESVPVSTESALLEKIADAAEGGTAIVRLEENIALDDKLILDNNETVLLDLNGKNLTLNTGTYNDKQAGIQLTEGSALTVINGTLTSNGGRGYVISTRGAEVTLSGVTIENTETAINVLDNASQTGDSVIRLVGCTINTEEEAIYLRGNGDATGRQTRLLIENTTLYGGYIGVMGNGSEGQQGTDTQIINSTVSGYWAGIYQPQFSSVTTISNRSTVSGLTGAVIKGGTLNVVDSTVRGVGTETEIAQPSKDLTSGFWDTGAGISVETNYGHEIVVNVTGGNIISLANDPLLIYHEDADNVTVTVTSGVFNGAKPYVLLEKYLAEESQGELIEGDYYQVSPEKTAAETMLTEDLYDEESVQTFAGSDRTSAEADGEDVVFEEEELPEDGNVPAFDPSELTEEEVAAILANNASLEEQTDPAEEPETSPEEPTSTEESEATPEEPTSSEEPTPTGESEGTPEEITPTESENTTET